MIPLIQSLDSALATSLPPETRAELRIRRATYMLRAGDFQEAATTIQEIRSAYGYDLGPRVSIWIILCEGLLSYFQGLGGDARDRLMRAMVLASAAQIDDLELLARAWLAHIDLNRSDYISMGENLRLCLERTRTQSHISALLRAEIVIGDISTYCGRFSVASHWYRRALNHAVQQGDQLSIEAVMYNRTAFRLARVRALRVAGLPSDEAGDFTRMEVASTASYYSAVGYEALGHLIVALQARSELLFGEWHTAAAKFKRLVEDGLRSSYISDLALLKSELAVCELHIGRREEAARILSDFRDSTSYPLGPDDAMSFVSNLVFLGEALDCSEEWMSSRYREFSEAKAAYAAEMASIERVLSDLSVVAGLESS